MTFEEPEFQIPEKPRWTVARVIKTIVVPLVFAVLLLWFVWNERARLEPLKDAPPHWVAVLMILVLIAHFLNSTEFWLLYRSNGTKSGIFENWMLFLASQLGNYVPGQGGTLYRLRYMRAVHNVTYPESVAVYGANFVVTLVGASLTAFIGVIGFALTGGRLSYVLLLVSAGLIASAVAAALVPLPKFASGNGRIARAWKSFHRGFEQIRNDLPAALLCVALEVTKYLATGLRMYIAFRLLEVHESFWFFLVLAPAAGLAQFVAFTPGAFGFRELFITGAAAALGVGFDYALLVATLERAVLMLVALGGGSIAFLITYPRLRAVSPDVPAAQSTG